jgi:ABC-2 type transport system permease protein
MRANVFARTLAERGRATLLYALGMAAVVAMYLGVFPSMQDQMAGYLDAVPEALMSFLGNGNLADAAGYIGMTVFGVFGPVVIVAAGSTWAAGAIAGEEEAHTLSLLLTTPQSRVAVAVHKLAAIVVALALVVTAVFAALWAMSTALDLQVGVSGLLAGSMHLFALGLFAAGLAFAVGAGLGNRALALGLSLGVVVLGFVMSGMAGYVDGLDVLASVSPFHWYSGSSPVENGVAWGYLGLLVGFAVAFAAAGVWRFDRRDLRT